MFSKSNTGEDRPAQRTATYKCVVGRPLGLNFSFVVCEDLAPCLQRIKFGNKLSESVPAMFVASFIATLWQEEILNICMVVCTFEIFWRTCSTRPPSGNQVDGLPLVPHNECRGNNRRFGIKHIWAESGWKRVVLRILLSDRSQSVYKHRLDIKETFCDNGVTNESL